jgi:hypothetical protein
VGTVDAEAIVLPVKGIREHLVLGTNRIRPGYSIHFKIPYALERGLFYLENKMIKDSKSKVHGFERFATSLTESDEIELQEIGEELFYFVAEWKKELGIVDEEE